MPMALVKAGYFFFLYRKMLTTLRIISAWSLGGGGSARSEMVLGHMMVGFLALFFIIFFMYTLCHVTVLFVVGIFHLDCLQGGGKQDWPITWGQNATGTNPASVVLFWVFF